MSRIFASDITKGMRPLLRKTLEYGFEIVGWVMLWYAIEVLVFQPIAIKHNIAALRRLMALLVCVDLLFVRIFNPDSRVIDQGLQALRRPGTLSTIIPCPWASSR